ncbi:MAG: type VI secretion system baseplate subunit TssE [Gammaproteobacteria bacterium]|nr:type VI secretion system baseplate subunit TssE [Gammaproteobacteria bacterium]MDH5727614.1 type VI secretion system baseplate subunit TssE [Gammaproteobacteria bacterium]
MSSEVSFLERLTSDNPLASRYTIEVNPEKMARSVLKHLNQILNSRQGASACVPDYGLPDFNDMVSRFPDAIAELRREIKRCIEKYEPRLSRVRVVYIEDPDNPLSLRYEISAQLILDETKEEVWFETFLDASGQVKIRGS